MACIEIYAIGAQLERGQPVSLTRSIRAWANRVIGTELVFALLLLIVFLIWARAGSAVSIFIPNNPEVKLVEMTGYLFSIEIVSLIFLSLMFSISVFSFPMIMHRDVDAVTAVVTSINAVLRNKIVMLIWGLMIAVLVTLGILSAGLLLIVFLPAIGHAVWYGYKDTIDASAFPRHTQGITSTPINRE